MRSLLHRRPTAATVISCTALFVALGGTSYAAVTLDGKDLKNRSVAASKVKTRTLTGTQVKNDALTGKQIKESTLGTVPSASSAANATRAQRADSAGSADNATNAQNAQDAKNAETAQTAQAAQTAATATTAQNAEQLGGKPASGFAASVTRVVTESGPVIEGTAAGAAAATTAGCNADERAIAGGGAWMSSPLAVSTSDRVTIAMSRPLVFGGQITGWQVNGRNAAVGVDKVLRAYVICTPKS